MTPLLALLAPVAAIAAILVIRQRRGRPGASAPSAVPPKLGPIPDVKGLVDPAAFGAFPAWVVKFEGHVPTMYRDVIGLITVGVGNLIDQKGLTPTSEPPARVFSYPWLRPNNTPATQDEIRAEWRRVKAMPAGLVASKYVTPGALHLSPAAVADLVARANAGNVKILAQTFPDFPRFPPSAQTALLGMAWGMGAGFPQKWPTFSASVRARDWSGAAANCKIKDANADRNEAHRALFLQAAGVA